MQKLKWHKGTIIDNLFFYVIVVLLGGIATLTGIMLIGLIKATMS